MRTNLLASLAPAAALFACGDIAGPGDSGTVTLDFVRTSSDALAFNGMTSATESPLDGDNGTLTIDDIRLVVDEFKLARVEGACEQIAENEDEDCRNFELSPFFVSVPAEGEAIGEVSADVGTGTYQSLKFETKAPDAGGELLADIRTNHFEDWPEEASMLVAGTFTPTEGDAVPFRVYFDAEVKVELSFADEEPLVVEEGGDPSVTVFVDPAIWFVTDDGAVVDLSANDFEVTGEVFKFEAKFADGFTKIEIDG